MTLSTAWWAGLSPNPPGGKLRLREVELPAQVPQPVSQGSRQLPGLRPHQQGPDISEAEILKNGGCGNSGIEGTLSLPPTPCLTGDPGRTCAPGPRALSRNTVRGCNWRGPVSKLCWGRRQTQRVLCPAHCLTCSHPCCAPQTCKERAGSAEQLGSLSFWEGPPGMPEVPWGGGVGRSGG